MAGPAAVVVPDAVAASSGNNNLVEVRPRYPSHTREASKVVVHRIGPFLEARRAFEDTLDSPVSTSSRTVLVVTVDVIRS